MSEPTEEAPIELDTVELPPPFETPGLRFALAGLALLQLVVALVLYDAGALTGGWCPGAGSGWSCGTLFRPRVGALGPFSVAGVAALGSLVTVGLAWDLLFRGGWSPLARFSVPVLAAGAGFALGVQALAATAQGALCPPCLGLALLALGNAVLAVLIVRREAYGRPRNAAIALAVALATTAGLGAMRGSALAAEDETRRAAALVPREGPGPRILLFERPGCPFCQGLLVDALGDPSLRALLDRTKGVERVGPDDPRVAALKIPGAPVLVALDDAGAEKGPRHEGYAGPEEVAAWLEKVMR